MRKIGVAADSHSSITQDTAEALGIRVLPMPFYIDGACYYEGAGLSREQFFQKLTAGAKISTSQPAPETLIEAWDELLEEYEQLLYFPISSGLSGSCSTAQVLAEEPAYEGRVFVVDNGRVSTPMHRAILDALELIEEGYSAARIQEILERDRDKMSVYVAVDTLEFLKRGGRITPAIAAIGTVLNIKPILKLGTGLPQAFSKSRGFSRAKEAMIEAIRRDLETVFKPWDEKGHISLLAAGSASSEDTEKWLEQIRAAFPGREVLYDDLALAVCCHAGPGALGVGISCRPDRP